MVLDRITLSRFRNHAESRLDETSHFNLLVGENGAGKTNVLEALSLFAPGRGLRRAALTDMAMKAETGDDATGCAVSAQLASDDQGDPINLGTGTRADRPGRRIVQINGAESSAMALGEWLAIAWLTPAMDGLFTDSAGARRRYMDRLALALDPNHARHASRYDAALRERNRLLDAELEPDGSWLDAIEVQLAEHGAALATGRALLVEQLMAELAILPEQPFARPTLAYVAGGPFRQSELAEEFRKNRPRDRAARRTLVGPQRDDLEVVMAGKLAPAATCSTGEQKAMLIAITLAHANLAARGRPSLLLLDEVAAHLDPLRREALFMRLREGKAQIWMTGTELAPFEASAREAAIWLVSSGTAKRAG